MFAEIAQDGVKVNVVAFGRNPDDGDSGAFERESFRRIERLRGEDCDVTVSRFDEVRFERQAQARIDHGAKKFFAPRLAGAVGHARIVGEDRADAGEEGVGFVTEVLDGFARRLRL